jgi:hypothetical protein
LAVVERKSSHGAARLGGKDLARNLATLHGQMRNISLQGACKVAFFTAATEQMRTKIYQYFKSLRRKICISHRIEQQPFNQVVLSSHRRCYVVDIVSCARAEQTARRRLGVAGTQITLSNAGKHSEILFDIVEHRPATVTENPSIVEASAENEGVIKLEWRRL